MKISISNIAWDINEDHEVLSVLHDHNIKGIEIAPTKIWNNPIQCSSEEAKLYKTSWNNKGIDLVAMQSLLYGQNNLLLFQDLNSREAMKSYLKKIIELASRLGIKALVFGSPKNRLVGDLCNKEQYEIAIPFFYELGQYAHQYNVTFCIEPNPKHYGCDFITDSAQGLEIVKEVDSDGFRLHLDAAGMFLAEENISKSIEKCLPYIAHFHISEPYLELIGKSNLPHAHFSSVLKTLGYSEWISIEMKSNLNTSNVKSVKEALKFVVETY